MPAGVLGRKHRASDAEGHQRGGARRSEGARPVRCPRADSAGAPAESSTPPRSSPAPAIGVDDEKCRAAEAPPRHRRSPREPRGVCRATERPRVRRRRRIREARRIAPAVGEQSHCGAEEPGRRGARCRGDSDRDQRRPHRRSAEGHERRDRRRVGARAEAGAHDGVGEERKDERSVGADENAVGAMKPPVAVRRPGDRGADGAPCGDGRDGRWGYAGGAPRSAMRALGSRRSLRSSLPAAARGPALPGCGRYAASYVAATMPAAAARASSSAGAPRPISTTSIPGLQRGGGRGASQPHRVGPSQQDHRVLTGDALDGRVVRQCGHHRPRVGRPCGAARAVARPRGRSRPRRRAIEAAPPRSRRASSCGRRQGPTRPGAKPSRSDTAQPPRALFWRAAATYAAARGSMKARGSSTRSTRTREDVTASRSATARDSDGESERIARSASASIPSVPSRSARRSGRLAADARRDAEKLRDAQGRGKRGIHGNPGDRAANLRVRGRPAQHPNAPARAPSPRRPPRRAAAAPRRRARRRSREPLSRRPG